MSAILSIPSLIPVHIIAQTAFIFALSFFGFRQTKVFARSSDGTDNPEAFVRAQYPKTVALPEPTNSSNPEVFADTEKNKARYNRSGLTKENSDEILGKLLHFMRSERPYLEPEITIEKLAKRLAVKRHHLTEVINEGLEKNFFLFINEYRIASVKHALADEDGQSRTLLDIAYDAGFNSKSSFNLAFKRIMGTTPSQYRKQQADFGEPED
jgi:AraC-like DNA-binding protein